MMHHCVNMQVQQEQQVHRKTDPALQPNSGWGSSFSFNMQALQTDFQLWFLPVCPVDLCTVRLLCRRRADELPAWPVLQ